MESRCSKVVTSTMLLIGLALAFAACQTTYSTEPTQGARTAPGSIEFVGRNMLVKARGTFHRWSLRSVEVDRQHPERSVVEVDVDIASIDTGIEKRDDHLRSADFFDVDRFPTATIVVDSVAADGDSESGHPRYRASFHVRIRDVEKTIEGDFEMVDLSPPRVEGDLVLDRADWPGKRRGGRGVKPTPGRHPQQGRLESAAASRAPSPRVFPPPSAARSLLRFLGGPTARVST